MFGGNDLSSTFILTNCNTLTQQSCTPIIYLTFHIIVLVSNAVDISGMEHLSNNPTNAANIFMVFLRSIEYRLLK